MTTTIAANLISFRKSSTLRGAHIVEDWNQFGHKFSSRFIIQIYAYVKWIAHLIGMRVRVFVFERILLSCCEYLASRIGCSSIGRICSGYLFSIFNAKYLILMFSCSIKGDEGQQFVYGGDRQAEDIVHFASRVVNPTIRLMNDHKDLRRLRKDETIFFAFIGDAEGELWVCEIFYNQYTPQCEAYDIKLHHH